MNANVPPAEHLPRTTKTASVKPGITCHCTDFATASAAAMTQAKLFLYKWDRTPIVGIDRICPASLRVDVLICDREGCLLVS